MPPKSPVSIRIQQYARSHVGISLSEEKKNQNWTFLPFFLKKNVAPLNPIFVVFTLVAKFHVEIWRTNESQHGDGTSSDNIQKASKFWHRLGNH